MKLLKLIFFLLLSSTSTLCLSQTEHDTKLTFGYTAKPLAKGSGYVNTYDGIIYQAEIGITPYLSVGVGSTVFTFLNNYPDLKAFGLRAKIAFPINEQVHVGIGTILMPNFDSGEYTNEINTLTSGLVTVAKGKSQFTFGLGFINKVTLAFPDRGLRPLFNFGFIIPVSKRGFLVGENWVTVFPSNYIDRAFSVLSGWAYRLNLKRFSLDMGA